MSDAPSLVPKKRSRLKRIMMVALSLSFAAMGVVQMRSGIVSGTDGVGPVARVSDPGLFWIYVAAYFAIAGWILVVALSSSSSSK
jgi:hypothetical protein